MPHKLCNLNKETPDSLTYFATWKKLCSQGVGYEKSQEKSKVPLEAKED